MMTVDVEKLQRLADEGYLTGRSHLTADLTIWNYMLGTEQRVSR